MDDNELISSGGSRDLGESETKLIINGANRVEDDNNNSTAVVSPSVTVVCLEGIGTSSLSSSSVSAVNKRQGLKKWRRIPRELAKKTGINVNNNGNSDLMLNFNGDHVQPVSPDSDLSSRSSTAASPPRTRIGSEKKARSFNIQKENSMGSDSGRSNFVFVQGSNSLASKGRQTDPTAEYDEESGDDKDLNEEAQIAFIKSDDPLVESIKGLHFAQEEFEKEVQKWSYIGKDDPLIFNDPLREIIELKDAKILELELALSSGDVKTEVEDCLMKMIQADVENVVITATTKRLIEGPLREIERNVQQKNVSLEDVQITNKHDVKLETKESLKKLQSRVCRFTLCFVIQFILLLVTLYLKFSPQNVEVVPT